MRWFVLFAASAFACLASAHIVRGGAEPVPSEAEGHPPRSANHAFPRAVGTETHHAKRLVALAGAAPDGPAEAEAAEPLPAEVERILDKMEAAGKDIRTLRARFDYELNQTLYEDIQKRKGRLAYAAPNRLRFAFTDRPKETFVFDGRVVYHVKPSTRQLILWEMRTADEPPVETLALGKTPFPLPFGQQKAAVLKHLRVRRDAQAEKKDPRKRAVLVLVPKKGTTLAQDYAHVLLWIDTKRWMPTRARLLDPSENVTTVDFHHIETNVEVEDATFARPEVPDDWEVVEHRKADEKAAQQNEE